MVAKKAAPALLAGLGAVMAGRALRRGRPFDFDGASVVITGGSRGLGLNMARQLAEEGARLTILARDKDELARAKRDIQAHARGAQVLTVVCDVAEQRQVQDAIEAAVRQYGRLDVLINNAGQIIVGPVENMAVADYERMMAVNLRGPLYGMYAALPHMKRQGGGRIVNIASVGGKVAIPHLVPYCASKFALVGLSDGMRAELARHNIRITTVCPGELRTGAHLNSLFKGQQGKEFEFLAFSESSPASSMDAGRAARQIVDACRHGDPALTISVQARAMAISNALFPSVTAAVSATTARFLPRPDPDGGNRAKLGWDSFTKLAPSLLTFLEDKAAVDNNGLKGHKSPLRGGKR